jgi:hypothetical protein
MSVGLESLSIQKPLPVLVDLKVHLSSIQAFLFFNDTFKLKKIESAQAIDITIDEF